MSRLRQFWHLEKFVLIIHNKAFRILNQCDIGHTPSFSQSGVAFMRASDDITVRNMFLTCYRSIEELQQQNQKLLGVIRELSEEKEKREGDDV